MIHNCKLSPERLRPFEECTRDSSGDNRPGEWPGNYLSTATVAYSCGILARKGEKVEHNHEPDELALCKSLAEEAGRLMEGNLLCMGDESDHEFAPLYIAANQGDPVPKKMTEEAVRAAFRGLWWPQCHLKIEPLKAHGDWWARATSQAKANEDHKALATWKALVDWFGSHKELHAASFVTVEDKGPGTGFYEPMSCIFPRFVMSFTHKGSVVGLFGCVVHT